MKTKNFHDYLKTRLTDEEIAEIKQKAQVEVDFLVAIQKILSDAMADLTLASFAHFLALMGKEPKDVFKA